MKNVNKFGILERAANVAIASAGFYLLPYALITDPPWQIVLPILAIISIAMVLLGIPKMMVRILSRRKLEGFAVALAILLSLTSVFAFGFLAAMLIFGLTLNVPLPEQGGVALLLGSLIASLVNLIMLGMNAAALLAVTKASENA